MVAATGRRARKAIAATEAVTELRHRTLEERRRARATPQSLKSAPQPMGSVAELRYCANREQCVRYDTTSRRAQKLNQYNAENECEACQREEVVRSENTPPEHAELFRVARLLFRTGLTTKRT
jgi:hypothetical protein